MIMVESIGNGKLAYPNEQQLNWEKAERKKILIGKSSYLGCAKISQELS